MWQIAITIQRQGAVNGFESLAGVWRGRRSTEESHRQFWAVFGGDGRRQQANGVIMAPKRLVFGTVEKIRGPEVKVNTGDLMPRLLSLKQARDKNHVVSRAGDIVFLVINNPNNVIEYSVFGEEPWNVAINGKLLQSVPAEQSWALIQYQNGMIRITPIDADARTKIAALAKGKSGTFLLDASHTILDVTF